MERGYNSESGLTYLAPVHVPIARRLYMALFVMMTAVTAGVMIAVIWVGGSYDIRLVNEILFNALGMIPCLILYWFYYAGIRSVCREDLYFLTMVALVFLEFLCTDVMMVFEGKPAWSGLLYLSTTLWDLFDSGILLLIWLYGRHLFPNDRKKKIASIIVYVYSGLFIAVSLGNVHFKWLFEIDSDGIIRYYYVFYSIFFVISHCGYLWFVLSSKLSMKKKLTLCSYVFSLQVYYVFSIAWVSRSDMALFISGPVYFMLFSLYIIFFNMGLEEREIIFRQNAELEKWEMEQKNLRNAVMISQIKPHFIYNSLATISHLCRKDAKLAKTATDKFADYLRMNLDFSESPKMIPFAKELEHIKTYLWLEKLRFGDDLKARYKVKTEDFMVPPLLIQPLVENAVKHGIRGGSGRGTVRLTVTEKGGNIIITVSDDGRGFDVRQSPEDGQQHIGLKNVRERLEKQLGGEMRVASVIGEGTKITVIFPKKIGGGRINESFDRR